MSKRGKDFLQNPKIQGKMRDLDKLQDAQRREDLRFIMSHPNGRRFMHELIFDRCELMSVYPGQDSGIYRNAGARDVGFKLARELQAEHVESYVLMIEEQLRERDNRKKLMDAALTPKSDEPEESDG